MLDFFQRPATCLFTNQKLFLLKRLNPPNPLGRQSFVTPFRFYPLWIIQAILCLIWIWGSNVRLGAFSAVSLWFWEFTLQSFHFSFLPFSELLDGGCLLLAHDERLRDARAYVHNRALTSWGYSEAIRSVSVQFYRPNDPNDHSCASVPSNMWSLSLCFRTKQHVISKS